jgi:hypothetical protein
MRRSTCNTLPATRRLAPAYGRVPDFIASSAVKPRAAMSASEAVRQMAEDMRQAEYREGGVSADDLEALGFTRAQIKTHGADARARAQALAGVSL